MYDLPGAVFFKILNSGGRLYVTDKRWAVVVKQQVGGYAKNKI